MFCNSICGQSSFGDIANPTLPSDNWTSIPEYFDYIELIYAFLIL